MWHRTLMHTQSAFLYRGLVYRKRLARGGGAPIMSDRSDLSDMSDNTPHQTPMHTQSAFQYWGVSVIPLVAA